ncbi:MAG: ABC transporter ATP-binding protein, partial [Anaerolineaceae bacterium]|nr:ABC transporter ATP-binding protein [Anaerolineaceae bacterium]
MFAKTDSYDLKNAVSEKPFKGMLRLLSGFGWRYAGSVASQAVAVTAKTATFFLLRYFVDDFFGAEDPSLSLPLVAVGFILLALLEGGGSFLTGRLAAQVAEGSIRRLRNYLFNHIQHLRFSYHDQTETGELISRSTSDVDALRRFVADQAINFARITLLFVINFAALLMLHVRLALLSVLIVPVIVGISVFFFKKVSSAYEAYQEQEAALSTTLQENLSGIRVVKAFARQGYEIKKFEHDNWEKFIRGKKLLTIQSLFWPISDIVCGIQIVFGYYLAARLAIAGEISVGTYLAYIGMVIYIIFPMRNLGRVIVQMSTGLVSYNRVAAILKQEREPLDLGSHTPTGGLKGKFVFDQVGFEYEPGQPVLENISFSCEPGQVIALLGSTGSGKTTLVNLLPRFYEYTQGSILLDDVELHDYPRRYLRRNIGIVEQEPFLFSRTIRDNIGYGVSAGVTQEEIEAAAQAAAVHDVILSFPQGYDTIVGEKGVTLSGGQKQR